MYVCIAIYRLCKRASWQLVRADMSPLIGNEDVEQLRIISADLPRDAQLIIKL